MTQESWAYLDLKSPKYLPKVAVPLYPLLCDLKPGAARFQTAWKGHFPPGGFHLLSRCLGAQQTLQRRA